MVKEMELSTLPAPASESKIKGTPKTIIRDLQRCPGYAGGDTGRQDVLTTGAEVTQDLEMPGTLAESCFTDSDPSQREQQDGAAGASELYVRLEPLNRGDLDSGFLVSDCRASPQGKHSNVLQQTLGSSLSESSSLCVARLFEKIDWASRELKDTASVEYSVQLCHLIKAAADAVTAVREART